MLIRLIGRLWATSFLVFVLLISNTSAQFTTITDPRLPDPASSTPGTCVLIVKLYSENASTPLEKQAVLKLTNLGDNSVIWQITDETFHGMFSNIPCARYELEISMVGYLTTEKQIVLTDSSGEIQ